MLHSYSIRRFSQLLPVLALILVNAIPLLGVLFLGWSAGTILFVYWAESIPIGFFALLRLGLAGTSEERRSQFISRLPAMLFFIIHFGMFMLVHRIFLFGLIGLPDLEEQEVAVLLASLFMSHGTSFIMNYINGREFEVTKLSSEMTRPYVRIFVMQVTLVVGGFVVMSFKEPSILLVLLVLLKTGIDLYSHIRNHSRYGIDAPGPLAGNLEQPGNSFV
jgi:hypothetical protein